MDGGFGAITMIGFIAVAGLIAALLGLCCELAYRFIPAFHRRIDGFIESLPKWDKEERNGKGIYCS